MMKNVHQEFLGFDIRLSPKDYVEAAWDQEKRDIYLLKPEIKWPLSIDKMIWPSFFHYTTDNYESDHVQVGDAIDVKPLNTRHMALRLWPDLEEMVSFVIEQRDKLSKKGILIAVVLVSEETLQSDEYWGAVLDPALSVNRLLKEWQFLGYDVADRYMLSGLSNCGYDENEKPLLKKTWSARLNEYGLLKTVEDARQFKQLSDQRASEHAPFFIYGLYRDPNVFSR